MKDLIERQAAIDAVNNLTYPSSLVDVKRILVDLPSAQPAQANLLDLMQDDEMSQAELANMTGKSRSTISRQIRQLEAAGAIVRMPSGKYRRNN